MGLSARKLWCGGGVGKQQAPSAARVDRGNSLRGHVGEVASAHERRRRSALLKRVTLGGSYDGLPITFPGPMLECGSCCLPTRDSYRSL